MTQIENCHVDLSESRVDAGGEVRLSVRLLTNPPADLRGRSLEIRDHEGRQVGQLAVTTVSHDVNRTGHLAFAAPDDPGEYTWIAALSGEAGDVTGPGTVEQVWPFTLIVTPHRTHAQVWRMRSAIERGRDFEVNIGVKCSSGCNMAGRHAAIMDEAGRRIAELEVPDRVQPGSEGLHVAKVTLQAPEEGESHRWALHVPASHGHHPHDPGRAEFLVRTVPPSEFTVRVEAIDSDSGRSLERMSVVMHPYRGMTDETGTAELRVARGQYKVYVSGPGYYPVQRDLEVAGDITTSAPLEAEPPPSKDW